MAGRTKAQLAAAVKDPPVPPFYLATATLWHGGTEAVAVAAFRAGDRVSPDSLAANPQWGPDVAVPEQFREALPPPSKTDQAGDGAGPGTEE